MRNKIFQLLSPLGRGKGEGKMWKCLPASSTPSLEKKNLEVFAQFLQLSLRRKNFLWEYLHTFFNSSPLWGEGRVRGK